MNIKKCQNGKRVVLIISRYLFYFINISKFFLTNSVFCVKLKKTKLQITEKKRMFNEKMVLCASNAYEKKYYLNDQFSNLPERVKQELQIMCVLFTEEVGGILILQYEEDGTLQIVTEADEGDLLYDDIGCGLKVKQMQLDKRELLESLEMYYKVFVLGEE